jgi:lysophospholipase L1-like esterase
VKLPLLTHRILVVLTLVLLVGPARNSRAADAIPTTPPPNAATPTPVSAATPVVAPPAALLPPLPPAALLPAPVPSAVSIARPSADEVALAAKALDQFLAHSDPATKAVTAKYPDLVAVRPPRVNPLLVPGLAPGFRQKHANNVARAQQGDIDLLFLGDSITEGWRTGGKAVFEKYYGNLKTANFGISGDTVQGVLYRLRDGEGEGFKPKAIMLMIGTNNAFSASSAEIAEGVGAIVLDLRTRFPEAKILLLAIFPRATPGEAARTTVVGVNPLLAKLDDGKKVFYLDIGDKFLAADGTLPADIMPDKLHPNAKGYEIWAAAVSDKLAELMK